MKLWLDDLRPAPEGWVWAKTYTDAMHQLFQLRIYIDEMSLDHDLGNKSKAEGGDGDGYDFICLVEQTIHFGNINIPEKISCHSDNGPGRRKIEKAIENIYHGRIV